MTRLLSFIVVFNFFMISITGQTLIAPTFIAGDSYTMGVTDSVIVGDAGENMVWNYSELIPFDTYNGQILSAVNTPFADDYPYAEWIQESVGQTIYFNNGPYNLEYFGGVENEISYPLTDSETFYPYPFSFGETWTDEMGGILNIAGITTYRSGIVESTLDGYGTLELPGGVFLDDVIRISLNRTITDSTSLGEVIYDIQIIEFFQGILYTPLVSHTLFNLIEGIDTTEYNFTTFLQSYTVGIDENDVKPTNTFAMFPNPASNNVKLAWSNWSSPESFEVRDVTGRLVDKIYPTPGISISLINVSDWSVGVYSVTINPGTESSFTRRLIIEK